MDSNVASIPNKLMQREQHQELRQELYHRREEPGVKLIRQLASYHLDKCKDQLLKTSGEEMYRLQGEGRTWDILLRVLAEGPRVPIDRDKAA